MSSIFHQRACYPQETTFTNLFRLLDDFDSYSREANPRANTNANANAKRPARLLSFTPRFDVRETETTYELHGELPGVEKEDLSIDFNDQSITVNGRVERKYSAGTPPAGLIAQESTGEKKQLEANDGFVAVDNASHESHKTTVADEVEEEARENGSTASGAATPAETVKDSAAVSPAAAPKKPAEKYWHQERSIGEFHRTFSFPHRIDESGVAAKLENGVLHISVPKAVKPAARRIAIN